MVHIKGVYSSTERACNLVSAALTVDLENGEQRICVMEEDLRFAREYISGEIARFEKIAYCGSDTAGNVSKLEERVKSLKMLKILGIFADKVLESRGKERYGLAVALSTRCSAFRTASIGLSGRFENPALEIPKLAPTIANTNSEKRQPARGNRNLN